MSDGYKYGLALIIWALTLHDVFRTQNRALSRNSQLAWVLGLIFLSALFIPFYWLTEAWRRRRRSAPPAV